MTLSATSRRALSLGALALALALTACGGESSPAGKSKDSAATSSSAVAGSGSKAKGSTGLCNLITREEAQDALKQPLTAGVSRSAQTAEGLSGGCKYLGTTVNAKTHGKGLVQVAILGTKLTRSQYDQLATSEGKIGAEAAAKPVPGLGETAFYVPGLLTLFDHGLAMIVQAVKADGTQVGLAVMTQMAHKALDRAGDLR